MFKQIAAPSKKPRGTVIYEPKGRAREYASLACNLYTGCDHGCTYCFAPNALRKTRTDFDNPKVRADFLHKLSRDCQQYQGITKRILLCFTCDPYQHLDVIHQVTREAITMLHHHDLHVEILTKGGSRALRDLDLFTSKDTFATTLTTLTDAKSLHWEPNAATPQDRIDTIHQFHAVGIPTWVSLEPVLYANVSLDIIRQTSEFVDVFKVGTLNYHKHAQTIDWPRFARDSIQLLTSIGYRRNTDPDILQSGDFYVKRDLARFL